MKSNKLTKQGGSVATFVVVGVVLTAFVFGGVYLLQKRSQDSQKTGPIAVSTSPSPTNTSKTTSSPQTTKLPSQSPAKPSPSKTPTATSAPSNTSQPQTTGNIPTNALPKTGPTEDFIGALMLALFAGVVVAYLRSYRVRYGYQTE